MPALLRQWLRKQIRKPNGAPNPIFTFRSLYAMYERKKCVTLNAFALHCVTFLIASVHARWAEVRPFSQCSNNFIYIIIVWKKNVFVMIVFYFICCSREWPSQFFLQSHKRHRNAVATTAAAQKWFCVFIKDWLSSIDVISRWMKVKSIFKPNRRQFWSSSYIS